MENKNNIEPKKIITEKGIIPRKGETLKPSLTCFIKYTIIMNRGSQEEVE